MSHPKGLIPIVVVIFITIIAAGVVGAAWYYEENKNEVVETNINSVVDKTADWQTYTNNTYNFSFKYPTEWKIDEESNRVTIYKGENKDGGFGFYVISGSLQDVVDSINNIQTLQVGETILTHANGIPANVINVTQTSVNQNYTELAIDLSNGNFARLTPYELNLTTGFPSVIENQEVIFSVVNSFTLNIKENTSVDTSDWENHINEAYNFSFKYPSEWGADNFLTDCSVDNPPNPCALAYTEYHPSSKVYGGDGDVAVTISRSQGATQNLTRWFNDNEELNKKVIRVTLEKVDEGTADVGPGYATLEYWNRYILVAGMEGIVQYIKATEPAGIEGPASTSKTYYFLKDGDIYTIFISTPTGDYSESLIAIGDAIVSTFEFTDVDDTTNWETYTDDTLGFQIELPQDWHGYTSEENINQSPLGENRDYSSVKIVHPKTVSDKGNPGEVSFNIYVFDSSSTELPTGVKLLNEVNSVRYGYSKGNAAIPDELEDYYNQIDEIVATLKVL